MASEATDLLKSVPLFAGLDPRELETIARTVHERTFAPGEMVAEENQGGALITEGPRTATVTAETELKCYCLTPWEFRPLVQTNASIAWKILQALAKQVEQRH